MVTTRNTPNKKADPTWDNKSNADFYDSTPLDLLPNFAIKGGLDTGCELNLIASDISRAENILELGAGYGRIIKNILLRGYTGKLVAVERSLKFYHLLKTTFGDKIDLIRADIKSLQLTEQFDLVLWLWSGICEFSQNEQFPILKKAISFLKPQGMLVVDSMLPTLEPTNASSTRNQHVVIPGTKSHNIYIYTPYQWQMEKYAKEAGCQFFQVIPYQTTTNRQRILYLIKK